MAQKTPAHKAFDKAHELVLKQKYDAAIRVLSKHQDDPTCKKQLQNVKNLKKAALDLKPSKKRRRFPF